MKWRRARKSTNVEDRRGRRVAAGGGLGLAGIAVVIVIGLLMGKNPAEMLGILAEIGQGGASDRAAQQPVDANDEATQFIASILGETEDVWTALFRQHGETYRPATLVLFTGQVRSACGGASGAMGPFYCPADEQIYIDLGFFEQMRTRLGGGGEFAEAYVIAHEVGHHIQLLTGVASEVNAARRRGEDVEGATGLLVRQELQADCYSGVWAHHAQQRHDWLEPGEIEQALRTASAIGDDRLQRQSGREVVPDSFTHGSSEQRMRWFTIGFERGEFARCDTFQADQL
ncbi:MAG: neutral zinc metallopeptidase [Xanthomonadales bacterium]|nr:neutral zinc metallopeptidase [Xanthomonadales bacterium]